MQAFALLGVWFSRPRTKLSSDSQKTSPGVKSEPWTVQWTRSPKLNPVFRSAPAYEHEPMLPAKKPIYQIYAKQQGSKRCYCSLINCESFCKQKQSFSRLQKKEKKISEPSGLSLVTSPRHLSWKSHIQKTRRPKKLFSIHPRFWDCFIKVYIRLAPQQ